ncbi:hypothetical protein ACFXO9_09580 [Nocardia tengchongensis]|uniref:LtfC-like domain-containing protein n=1 Tax=Nocardia tengchongensis TaxID=2055889 RepID=UPI0036814B0D
MTAPIDPGFLGYQPTVEPLKLTTGASFVQTIQLSGGVNFPANTSVSLNITSPSGATWSWGAAMGTNQASWNVANTTCDAVPANSRYTIVVTYQTPQPTTYAWYSGTVIRTS